MRKNENYANAKNAQMGKVAYLSKFIAPLSPIYRNFITSDFDLEMRKNDT